MKKLFPAVVVLLASLSSTVTLTAQLQSAAQPVDRFLEVNGLRIHYVDWGGEGKQPFVMIHGLDRVARTFDHVATQFTARYRVLAIDMRGHGDSGWDPQGRYLVEDHVGDLEGIVAQLKLRDLVLWGNSTGGRVVQVFAGKHPELVSRVISEDVGPERPRQIADGYAKRVEQERAGWGSTEELLAQLRKANPRIDNRSASSDRLKSSWLRPTSTRSAATSRSATAPIATAAATRDTPALAPIRTAARIGR